MIQPYDAWSGCWYQAIPIYELRELLPPPTDVALPPSPCTEAGDGAGEATAPVLTRVLAGYRWIAHPVTLSTPSGAWDQQVQARLDEADERALSRARELRRVQASPADPAAPTPGAEPA